MASKSMPSLFQCAVMGAISPVRSCKVKPFLNAVCVDSTAVGKMAASTPIAEIMGNATVSEHLPTQEISCTVTILFILLSSFPLQS